MTSETVDLLDLTLTAFPKDKKVTVFSYGSIYQSETNYSIAIISKERYQDNPAFMVSYINLKELFAFPLGTVIDNQQKTGFNSGSIDSFEINIHSGLLEVLRVQIKICTKADTDSLIGLNFSFPSPAGALSA